MPIRKIINTLLLNGYSRTKKYTLDDLTRELYILKYIIICKDGAIQSNNNAFWKPENFKNRMQFAHDVRSVGHSPNDREFPYFTILNRFENGDSYGIEWTRG